MTKNGFVTLVLVSLMVLAGSAKAQKADRQGPLGLTWGAAADDVRSLGAQLKELPDTEFGTTYAASNIPRALSDQEAAILSFGYDNSLWRIVVVSGAFNNDPSGSNLKARYQELLAILSDKYGKPSLVQSLGDSIYAEPQYFLAGIQSGRSYWYANFHTPDLTVQLGLAAEDSSTGRWKIIYANNLLLKAFDVSKKAKEKGAL